jgi:peptidoglycan/xylan/chitin deacetylase (PgdA/CDA1 family)
MAKRVLNYARNGTIILGHDGRLDREKTIQALPAIIEGYLKKGYRFVTLSELLSIKPAPKAQNDTNGKS